MTEPINVEDLLDAVCTPRSCKAKYITDPKAKEFVAKISAKKEELQEVNIAYSSRLLKKVWGIKIPSRALRAHVNGECVCPREKVS